MKSIVYIEFEHDEVRDKIHYDLIAETFSRGSRPTQTMRGKRIFKEMFPDKSEQEKVRDLVRKAKSYAYTKGVPLEGVRMTVNTFNTWVKLAHYCMEV